MLMGLGVSGSAWSSYLHRARFMAQPLLRSVYSNQWLYHDREKWLVAPRSQEQGIN